MCKFFSCVSNGQKLFYFNWEERQKLIKNNHEEWDSDSHTSIAAFFKLDVDKVNKYEYNPLTKKFVVDQINIKDDQAIVKRKLDNMDWKTIIEPLNTLPIINPLTDCKIYKVTKKDISNLKKWNSIWNSVGGSVWNSVVGSIWDSVGEPVWDSVRDSVWEPVGEPVWDSVGNSVWDSIGSSAWDSVGDSVWDSVWDSVGAYIGSLFHNITDWKYCKLKNPWGSLRKLWLGGYVPSFDGKTWRLHAGLKAKVVFEITAEELRK